MAKKVLQSGNYSSELYMEYTITTNREKMTWKVTTAMKFKVGTISMGAWGDYGDTYLGNVYVEGRGLNKEYAAGTIVTIISQGQTFTGTYNSSGVPNKTSLSIPWGWEVKSSWGGYVNPSGTATISIPSIDLPQLKVQYMPNGGTHNGTTYTANNGTTYYVGTNGNGYLYYNTSSSDKGRAYSTASGSQTINPINHTSFKLVKKGYSFNGWSYGGTIFHEDANLSISDIVGSSISKDTTVTFKASWSVNSYKIIFNGNGSGVSNVPSTISYTYSTSGSNTIPNTTPTRSGYTFKGWSTTSTGGVQYEKGDTIKKNIGKNLTLYAVWSTASDVFLHVWLNGGTWVGPDGSQIDSSSGRTSWKGVDNATVTIKDPVRPGYRFAGWFKTAYGTLSRSAMSAALFTSDKAANSIKVYNNSTSTGTVTHTKTESSEAGPGYRQVVTITSTGATSPGRGGFYFTQTPKAGCTYIHVFRAKAPVGTYFTKHYNTITGVSTKWLTSNQGTGEWRHYAYELKVPTGATTLGTFGYIALQGGPDPVTWYVTANQITKITDESEKNSDQTYIREQTFKYSTSGTTIYAQWVPENLVQIYVDGQWKHAIPYIYTEDEEWVETIPYLHTGNGIWKTMQY